MTRVVAVLVAVGLIVGAVLVRRAIDEDSGDDRSGPGETTALVLVCATELRAACETLDVEIRIEDAAVTADALARDTIDLDLWAVPAPWPEIVDDTRQRAGLEPLFGETTPVARSPLVAVGPEALDGCGWRCLGDRAADDLDLGARAATSGLGLLQSGALATGWFTTNDFATNDFDAAFSSWLAAIAAATTETDEPVTRLLQSQAFFDVALSFEAEAQTAFEGASEDRRAGLALLYPAPVAYLDVLVVDVGGGAGEQPSRLGAALTDAGWQSPSDDGPNLPRAGVLVALRDLL